MPNALKIATFKDVCDVTGFRPDKDLCGLRGQGWAELRDGDGELKELVAFENLITKVGDNYYGERAAGITSPPAQVTGMKLGTGTTAVAKSGAGAAIVTYVASLTASKAIDATWPQATLDVPGCQIQWKTTWNPGEATSGTNWGEVVITNETSLADDAGTAANTISRALLSPTIPKASGDTLAITWNHIALGA